MREPGQVDRSRLKPRLLTSAQAEDTYPEPDAVAGVLLAHGHHPRLNLYTGNYRPPWQLGDDAVCAQTDPEVFFPEKGGTTDPGKRVCASCEAREDCLLWAV